jgi:hypothetical protein
VDQSKEGVQAMSRSSSILRFVTDDSTQANESIASLLQRLCVFLEQDMPNRIAQDADIFRYQGETPSDCYSCKNYSHSPYLKCAVNPAHKIDQDYNDFELKALDWDSSEDNPANYLDWDSSEHNLANYSEN